MSDLHATLPALPARFNLCEYFLDHNLEAGRGDKVALVCGSDYRTYKNVLDGATRVAGALRLVGVRPEERVLIVLPDGFEFAEAFFGTLRVGAVFAMVNPLLKAGDFEHYLAYAKPRAAVCHVDVLGELMAVAEASPFTETLFVVGLGAPSSLGEAPKTPVDAAGWLELVPYHDALEWDGTYAAGTVAETGPDDLAGWLFTSGSTGHPKACVHTHADFRWSTETYAKQVASYREDDICAGVPKLFFGYATGTNLMFPFAVGATAVLFPERSTEDVLFDVIERHKVSFLTNVPTMINKMLQSKRSSTADLSSLRVSLSAGEALPESLYSAWMARTGVEILDGIGSAEMFHIYISGRPGHVRPGSLGNLVPGYEAEIVDAAMRPVAAGEVGRLRVRGGSTALCYWGDKRKSRETFQADWCTTGDLFRVDDDGYFYYEGRADDLLKVSGIFVSPLEIENALLEHEAVAEVCVVGHEEEADLTKPYAFVVCTAAHTGCEELAADLKAFLKDRLAPYKYPRWFEWCDELPKNDRGKIARKDLKARLAGE
jgi:benzoate-CoA ligase family protein